MIDVILVHMVDSWYHIYTMVDMMSYHCGDDMIVQEMVPLSSRTMADMTVDMVP